MTRTASKSRLPRVVKPKPVATVCEFPYPPTMASFECERRPEYRVTVGPKRRQVVRDLCCPHAMRVSGTANSDGQIYTIAHLPKR